MDQSSIDQRIQELKQRQAEMIEFWLGVPFDGGQRYVELIVQYQEMIEILEKQR